MQTKSCTQSLLKWFVFALLFANSAINSHSVQTVQAAGEVSVSIHYLPAAGDIRDWDLWVWTNSQDGEAFSFNDTDEYGKLAQFRLPEGTNTLNYVVRMPDWSAKDCIKDRTLTVVAGKAEVWLKGGSCEVSTTDPLADTQIAKSDINDTIKEPVVLPDAGMGGASNHDFMTVFIVISTMLLFAIINRKRHHHK
jgi:hypothetical protein